MADDFVPKDDPGFDSWVDNFDDFVQEHAADVGVTPEQKAESARLRGLWNAAYNAVEPGRVHYQGLVTAKDDAEKAYIDFVRPLVAQIQANPKTDDQERREMRIPIHKTTRTPVGLPQTSPIGTIDTSVRLRHSIDFRDSGTPNSKAKPEGVRGCQVWLFVGDAAPQQLSAYGFLAEDSRTPFHHDFDPTQVGQTAFYLLRWVNSKGEPGPWSTVLSATIGG